MHCQTCGYSLWNLAARECPECGARFLPGDFEFVPGTVQFCCPHCRHARHGTDDSGEPMRPIAYKDLAAELNDQNHYRWSLGLNPLPDPARVTHKRPATSP